MNTLYVGRLYGLNLRFRNENSRHSGRDLFLNLLFFTPVLVRNVRLHWFTRDDTVNDLQIWVFYSLNIRMQRWNITVNDLQIWVFYSSWNPNLSTASTVNDLQIWVFYSSSLCNFLNVIL